MRIRVVGLDVHGVHGGAVPHRALDHCGDLGGGAVDELGVNGQGLLLHVPVDEHPSAAVARVPLGEPVLVVGPHVGGVGGDRGRSLAHNSVLRAAKVAFAISIAICRAVSGVRYQRRT